MAAARAGADAIGINFDPSAGRCVSMEEARGIVEGLPAMVSAIGVFVNQSAQEIRRVALELGLGGVQLHGEESAEVVASLRPIPVIKVLHLRAGDGALIAKWREAIGDLQLTNLGGVLLETAGAPQRGGTGIVNDFSGLGEMQRAGAFEGLPPIILAGGLTAENVGQVVRMLRPFAVDVSSGVESGRRQKSVGKIEAFIGAVRDADGDEEK